MRTKGKSEGIPTDDPLAKAAELALIVDSLMPTLKYVQKMCKVIETDRKKRLEDDQNSSEMAAAGNATRWKRRRHRRKEFTKTHSVRKPANSDE